MWTRFGEDGRVDGVVVLMVVDGWGLENREEGGERSGRVIGGWRSKDVIISGGENFSNIEIKLVLYTHPTINEAMVMAWPDEYWRL
ncbi:hypothetical protein V6N13_106540 [Hibiscus sabdariffa]|uniref:Uncharacterized protein n=1 Tax=Hibiscus sabdariffa TaxID=183260 RepID=A0ABR2F0Z8_9ROSI